MDISNSRHPWLQAMATFFHLGPLAKVITSDLGPFLFDPKIGFRIDPKRELEVAKKIRTALCNEPIEYTITISKSDQPEIYSEMAAHNSKDLSNYSLECLRTKSNKDLSSQSIYDRGTDWDAGVIVVKITLTPRNHLYNDYSLSLAHNVNFFPKENAPLRNTIKYGKACDTFCDLGSEFISSGEFTLAIESSLRAGKNVILDLGSYPLQFPGELELLSSGTLGLGSFPLGTLTIDKMRTLVLFDQLFPYGIQNIDEKNKDKIPTFLESLKEIVDFKVIISINDKNSNPHLYVSFLLKDRPKPIAQITPERIETNIVFNTVEEILSLLNFEIKVGVIEESYNSEPYMSIESTDCGDVTITHELLDENIITNIILPIINQSLDKNRRITLKRKNIANEIETDYISLYKDDNNTAIYISDLSDRDFLPFACDLIPNLLKRSEEIIIPFNSCDDDYEAGRLAIKEFLSSNDIEARVWLKGKEIRVRKI